MECIYMSRIINFFLPFILSSQTKHNRRISLVDGGLHGEFPWKTNELKTRAKIQHKGFN